MDAFTYVSAALLAAWSVLLVASEGTRRGQLTMSLVGLMLSPQALALVSSDYRHAGEAAARGIGPAEAAFAFSLFGIAAVVAHYAVSLRLSAWRGMRITFARAWAGTLAHAFLAAGVWLFVSVALALVFGIPPFPALLCGGLLIGIYFAADRADALLDALLSGLLVACLVFVVEQVLFLRVFPGEAAGFWAAGNLSGILLAGIPVEEILWAATVGFAVGPLYEFARRPRRA